MDPATGRWISEDPSGFAAGDSNLDRYVGNNTTNSVDPTGLQEEPKPEEPKPDLPPEKGKPDGGKGGSGGGLFGGGQNPGDLRPPKPGPLGGLPPVPDPEAKQIASLLAQLQDAVSRCRRIGLDPTVLVPLRRLNEIRQDLKDRIDADEKMLNRLRSELKLSPGADVGKTIADYMGELWREQMDLENKIRRINNGIPVSCGGGMRLGGGGSHRRSGPVNNLPSTPPLRQ